VVYAAAPATLQNSAASYETVLKLVPGEVATAKALAAVYEKLKANKEILPVYEIIVKAEPSNKAVWLGMAKASQALKNDSNAIRAYKKSVEIDPKDIDSWITLGSLYESVAKKADAIKAYGQVVTLDPPNPDEYEKKIGFLYLDMKNKDSAAAHLYKAVEANPYLHEASFELGKIYEAANDIKQAVQFYDMASDAEETKAEYHYKSGSMNFRLGEYPNARQRLLKALAITPKLDDALFMLGQIRMTQATAKDVAIFKEAAGYFSKAVSLKPDNADYIKQWAEALYKAGDIAAAIPIYKQYLAKNDKDLEAHASLGRALLQTKQIQPALAEFDIVYKGRPQLIEDDYAIGSLYFDAKRFTEAKRIYIAVLRINPNNAECQERTGTIFESEKDSKNALFYLEEAVRVDSSRFVLKKRIGDLHTALGNNDKAISSYEAFLFKVKDVNVARNLLALYRKLNRKEDVRKTLSTVTTLDPADVASLKELGDIDNGSGFPKQALNSYLAILKVQPNNFDALYQSGVIYYNDKAYPQAVQNLTLAVKQQSNSVKASLALADALTASGKAADAVSYYNMVLQAEAKNESVVDKLIGVYRTLNNKVKLLEMLVKKVDLNPRAGDAVSEIGELQLAAGKNAEAEASFKKAATIKGECLVCYVSLSKLYMQQKNYLEAIDQLKKAVYIDAKNWQLNYDLGYAYLVRGDTVSAADAFEKVLYLKKDHSQALEYLSEIYVALKYQKKAITMLEEVQKSRPKDPAVKRSLGRAYFDTKEIKKAEAAILAARDLDPKSAETEMLLGDIYKSGAEKDKALTAYGRAYALESGKTVYAEKYAEALYEKKMYKDAVPVFTKLLAADPKNSEFVAALVDCYLSIGDEKAALKYVDALSKADPSKVTKNYRVAKAYYNMDMKDKALPILEAVGPQNEKDYYLMLGTIYKEAKIFGKAADAMKTLFNMDKSNKTVGFELGDIYEKRAEDGLAAEIYAALEISYPKDPAVKRKLVEIYKKLSKREDLRIVLTDLVALDPNDISSSIDLANLLFEDGMLDEAKRRLLALTKSAPSNAGVSALLGKILLFGQDIAGAEKYLSMAVVTMKSDVSVNKAMGQVYVEKKDWNKALVYLERAQELDAKDNEITEWLGIVYRAQKNTAKLQKLYGDIIKTDPKNSVAQKGLGDLYFDQKKYSEAMNAYSIAIETKEPDADILNRMAQMKMDVGDLNASIELYQRSLRFNPNQDEVCFKLGSIFLNNRGNEAAAKERLEQAVLINPKHLEALKMLARVHMRSKNDASAISTYMKALEVSKGNKELLGEMVPLLLRHSDFNSVESLLVQAAEANKDNFDIVNQLGRKYLFARRYKEAEPLLAGAFALKSTDVGVMMDLINLYNSTGESVKAIPILDKLIKTGGATNEIQLQLGIAYYNQADYRRAKEILERILTKSEGSADAITVLGQIYVKEKDVRKAKIALKKALEIDPANIRALYAMGEMALTENDFDMASAYFEKVAKVDPRYEGVAGKLAEVYLNRQDYSKARYFVEQGLKEDPKNGMLVLGMGRILFVEGKYDQAGKYLTQATAMMPDNDEPVYYSLMSLVKQKKSEVAMADARNALAKFKRSERIYAALAEAYTLASQYDRALKALELAVRINPMYKEGFLLTAELLHKHLNDSAAAIANYKRYISLGGNLESIPAEYKNKVQ
ncbi:MAG: tetratricopeptide repeat protein, partial [Fibrobacteres bacterium]|nr:tetratricopeptide repeat protein [Fibrobacterota bacterium]